MFVKQIVLSNTMQSLKNIFTGEGMLHLFLLSFFFFSFSLKAMEGNKTASVEVEDPNAYRDISIIDAYLDANFKLEEVKNEALFEFTQIIGPTAGSKVQIPLKTAAMVVFQMRRDRCSIAKFRQQVIDLQEVLKNKPGVVLKASEVKAFQAWRLFMFDSNQDLAKQRVGILDGARKELSMQEWGNSREKAKKIQEAEETLKNQEDQIRANREAYKNAFGSLVELELVNDYKKTLLRWSFVSVEQALENLRTTCLKNPEPLRISQF